MQQRELPSLYDPKTAEKKWYQIWEDQKSFKPTTSKDGKSFSIIMPPPNVTGKLHMGHALDHTCQDVLVRFKRMTGFETLWIPGTDHAGIATQSVVEKRIYKEEKKTKHDLGRDEFLKRVWAWKDEYEVAIKDQLKTLGDSCDWDNYTFTMDPTPNKAVKKFFVDFFNKGLIYQADYIVNWDPVLQSAISDAEVEYKEVKGAFYHLYYKVKDSDLQLEVATTRPETLFGDTAVAVNPNDERFKHLIGKTAIIPLCQREVPIIGDEHVDLEMGTGCLKVTPGHDFNDFEIGRRHSLPILNILNVDGTLNQNAGPLEGLKCKEARKKVVELLQEIEALKEVKEHVHQVGHGQRSDEIVEPMVSKQWFLNVKEIAARGVNSVKNDKTTFFPKSWENTYFSWLNEPKDWCISRQLWWGHQIPVYYCQDDKHVWASETEPTKCPHCQSTNFKQDPDVLDTWFSSGLWPLSTLGWPDEKEMKKKDFEKFFPTTTLVTGFDIIFFWVARMMMMSLAMTDKEPFKEVYVHAIVRDKHGKKMSKSLGNGIDPIDVINEFGADAMRFTLAAGSGYNRNLNLDPKKIEGYRNFMNKLWNAFRFIHPFLAEAQDKLPETKEFNVQDRWILSELNTVTKQMNESLNEYRFDDSCSAIYSFVYEKFCSWYIELSKNILYSDDKKAKVRRATILCHCFRQIVGLLHPVTPFITEEMWSFLKTDAEPLLISHAYPQFDPQLDFSQDQIMMNKFIEAITIVRNLRQSVNIKPKDEIEAKFFTDDEEFAKFLFENRTFMRDLAKIKSGEVKNKNADRPVRSIMGATGFAEIFIPLEGVIDFEDFVEKLKRDITKTKDELDKFDKKLSNPSFADRAPVEVVNEVKEKHAEYSEKLKSLEESLANFR